MMNKIEDYIRYWAKTVKKEYGVLNESNTPSDIETIKASFPKDVSDEKMVPTREFLETAYGIMNEEFFENKLPERLIFQIKTETRKRYIGLATYHYYDFGTRIQATAITLNASRTLSLHEWLNVVLHEMIHIYDYTNNQDHFTGFSRKSYDAHGNWFLEFGRQFDKYGFNVQKYCNADLGINTDNTRIKNRISNMAFLHIEGYKDPKTGNECMMVVPVNEVDKYVDYITYRHENRGTFKGLQQIVVYKSENPNIIRLKQVRMRNKDSGMSWYFETEEFKKKYGPFIYVKGYDVLSAVKEDKDEEEYDTMYHIDDEYARKMYDNIKGVVDVQKIKDGEYEVSIY